MNQKKRERIIIADIMFEQKQQQQGELTPSLRGGRMSVVKMKEERGARERERVEDEEREEDEGRHNKKQGERC